MKLIGYMDGTISQPSKLATQSDGSTTPNPDFDSWFCQDQLIVSLLLSFMIERDSIALYACETSHQLWMAPKTKYINPQCSHVMSLKNKLQRSHKGSLSIIEYLFFVKRIVDELAIFDHVISDNDIILYVLNGLDVEYKDIVASIQTRDLPFSFEELHSHLVVHEEYLKCNDALTEVSIPTANLHKKNRPFNKHF
ncbi:hypothetical protein POUND7_010122 [Theobroma cacao]